MWKQALTWSARYVPCIESFLFHFLFLEWVEFQSLSGSEELSEVRNMPRQPSSPDVIAISSRNGSPSGSSTSAGVFSILCTSRSFRWITLVRVSAPSIVVCASFSFFLTFARTSAYLPNSVLTTPKSSQTSLLTEDLQDGRVVRGVEIRNHF
jgi:hypothetical protein